MWSRSPSRRGSGRRRHCGNTLPGSAERRPRRTAAISAGWRRSARPGRPSEQAGGAGRRRPPTAGHIWVHPQTPSCGIMSTWCHIQRGLTAAGASSSRQRSGVSSSYARVTRSSSWRERRRARFASSRAGRPCGRARRWSASTFLPIESSSRNWCGPVAGTQRGKAEPARDDARAEQLVQCFCWMQVRCWRC